MAYLQHLLHSFFDSCQVDPLAMLCTLGPFIAADLPFVQLSHGILQGLPLFKPDSTKQKPSDHQQGAVVGTLDKKLMKHLYLSCNCKDQTVIRTLNPKKKSKK